MATVAEPGESPSAALIPGQRDERPGAERRRVGLNGTWRESLLAPVLALVLGVAGWELLVRGLQVPIYLVPAPSAVLTALVRGLSHPVTSAQGFYLHTGVTVVEALAGFAIGSAAGLLLGGVIAQSRRLERTVYPYLLAFQAVPKPALAPLFVLWFGFGMESKIVVTATITFFPLLVNSIVGLRSVDRDSLDLLRSYGTSEWRVFRMLRLPTALPFVFAGLEMAAIYCLIGALIGEFVGAQRGLGVLLINMNYNVDTAGLFATFVILTVVGLAMHGAVVAVERRVLFWSPRQRDENHM